MFLIAKVLDPKWKLVGTLKILEFYYNNLSSIDLQPLRSLQSDTNDNEDNNIRLSETFQINLSNFSVIKHAFEFELRTLFAEYEAKYNSTHQVRQRPTPHQQYSFGFFQVDDPDAQSQLADLYGYTTSGSSSARTVSELDLYFDSRFSLNEDEGPVPNQIDVLDWWGTHEKDFPILASMAKEIFSIPASTVAVESAFSVGGNVLDDRRSRLSGQNMEATMLLDDWCSADIRDQELDWNTQVQIDQDYYPDEEEEQQ